MPPPLTGSVMLSAAPAPSVGIFMTPAAAVGHQQIVFAILLIDDHVERTVAIAQFGDGRALDMGPAFEVGDWQLDQRGARISCEHVRLIVDAVGDESANGRLGLELAVAPW